MTTPSPPAFMPHGATVAARLGWIGLVLLLISCIALSVISYQQLRNLCQSSDTTRAQLMAQSIKQRIQHAMVIGIPLHELQGVEEFFRHRLDAHPDIQSLSIVMSDGSVLWETLRQNAQAASIGTVSEASVNQVGQPIANVRLQLRQGCVQTFAHSTAWLLAPVIVLLAVLAWLAALFSEAQGLQLRNFSAKLAIGSIHEGRYDRSFVIRQRREFDLRVQGLGHATRSVQEMQVRVRRLITSLRATEPQLARRERLDQLLQHAQGHDCFSEHGMLQIRVVATQAQSFWACLLTTLSAAALPALEIQALQPQVSGNLSLLTVCVFALSVCAGALCTRRLPWRMVTVALTGCLSLITLGTTWALGLMAFLQPTTGLLLTQIICGLVAGATLHAFLTVEKQPQHSLNTITAGPHRGAAAIGAWTLALLWLAPALASITHDALGPLLGAAALVMPAACCLIYLLRWNEPRSPWRVIPSPASPHTHAPSSMPGHTPFTCITACAIGVLSMLPYANLTLPQTLAVGNALGLGLLAGLFMRVLHQHSLAVMAALSAALWAASWFLEDDSLWHLGAVAVAAACLGGCLASALKSTLSEAGRPILHFLAPMVLGSVLAGLCIAAGMPAAMQALAAVMLVAVVLSKTAVKSAPSPIAQEQGTQHVA